MSRPSLIFEPKDEALRQDVGRLGTMLGELIREQCGGAFFETIESIRLASIGSREDSGESLRQLPVGVDPALESEVIRAFSSYFQAVNLAERVHRIRRRREWLREAKGPQPGNLEDAFARLRGGVRTSQELQHLLDSIRVEPVFTAHPTEPTRRTILRKQQRIARRLVELMDPALTPDESNTAWERIREELTSTWQTEEHPGQRMTVRDEFEHVLFFLTDVIYRVVPVFYEIVEQALSTVFGDLAHGVKIPVLIRFGSWVGGDMDGNPNASASTVRATLAAQRQAILACYRRELHRLADVLTQCPSRVHVDAGVLERCEVYGKAYGDVLNAIPPRHRNMPYRILCRLMAARLRSTENDHAEGYASSAAFLEDLQAIADSLRENRGSRAGLFGVRRLIWRVRTFGFHLATLDLRQDALVHRRVVGRLLGEPDWEQRPPGERAEHLQRLLSGPAERTACPDQECEAVLDVFRSVAESRRRYGGEAVGPYIVSMAQNADDVLSVLALARWAGLTSEEDRVPLDVAPLFETLKDLDSAADVLDRLLQDPVYAGHLRNRGARQFVMIGYSDSNKDAGIAGARWSLQKAESTLSSCADRHRVELILFHGRGGTISRGGGKTHVAVMAAPPGAVRGVLRVTEQGEIINAKYGLRGIALRTLEQAAGSVMLATHLTDRPVPEPAWHQAMDQIASISAEAYRALVHQNPEFYGFFRAATPIDVIERMNIGSRPPSRRGGQGVGDLRAIPWVFAWSQNRSVLPGWYGFAEGLEAALSTHGETLLREMFSEWMFMKALLEDIEMVLAKADMSVAEQYASLVEPPMQSLQGTIRARFERTVELVLRLKGATALLHNDPVLQRAIRLRNPYVDPMSLIQVDLLRRWREGGRQDHSLLDRLFLTVNGIAHGLQNTG